MFVWNSYRTTISVLRHHYRICPPLYITVGWIYLQHLWAALVNDCRSLSMVSMTTVMSDPRRIAGVHFFLEKQAFTLPLFLYYLVIILPLTPFYTLTLLAILKFCLIVLTSHARCEDGHYSNSHCGIKMWSLEDVTEWWLSSLCVSFLRLGCLWC